MSPFFPPSIILLFVLYNLRRLPGEKREREMEEREDERKRERENEIERKEESDRETDRGNAGGKERE